MSDGPYKSLPLPRGWKKVAKCAETEAFSVEDIRDAIGPAVVADWRNGQLDAIAQTIRAILDVNQSSLYDRVDQLEALKAAAAGDGFRQAFIDCAIQVTAGGAEGEAALMQAAENALSIWTGRHSRPIEEHYCREWDAGRANNVRERVEAGVIQADFHTLARQLLGGGPNAASRIPPRHTGVDEGPRR